MKKELRWSALYRPPGREVGNCVWYESYWSRDIDGHCYWSTNRARQTLLLLLVLLTVARWAYARPTVLNTIRNAFALFSPPPPVLFASTILTERMSWRLLAIGMNFDLSSIIWSSLEWSAGCGTADVPRILYWYSRYFLLGPSTDTPVSYGILILGERRRKVSLVINESLIEWPLGVVLRWLVLEATYSLSPP